MSTTSCARHPTLLHFAPSNAKQFQPAPTTECEATTKTKAINVSQSVAAGWTELAGLAATAALWRCHKAVASQRWQLGSFSITGAGAPPASIRADKTSKSAMPAALQCLHRMFGLTPGRPALRHDRMQYHGSSRKLHRQLRGARPAQRLHGGVSAGAHLNEAQEERAGGG